MCPGSGAGGSEVGMRASDDVRRMPVYVWGISAAVGILVVVAAAVWFVRGRHA